MNLVISQSFWSDDNSPPFQRWVRLDACCSSNPSVETLGYFKRTTRLVRLRLDGLRLKKRFRSRALPKAAFYDLINFFEPRL